MRVLATAAAALLAFSTLVTPAHAAATPMYRYEIINRANSWLTAPADQAILFRTPIAERWRAAARALGVDLSRLADYAGHA